MTHYSGSMHSIHVLAGRFGLKVFWDTLFLTTFFRQSYAWILKIGQILDFLKLGQRRLGTSGMVRVDVKHVCIGPLSCLEVSGTV